MRTTKLRILTLTAATLAGFAVLLAVGGRGGARPGRPDAGGPAAVSADADPARIGTGEDGAPVDADASRFISAPTVDAANKALQQSVKSVMRDAGITLDAARLEAMYAHPLDPAEPLHVLGLRIEFSVSSAEAFDALRTKLDNIEHLETSVDSSSLLGPVAGLGSPLSASIDLRALGWIAPAERRLPQQP